MRRSTAAQKKADKKRYAVKVMEKEKIKAIKNGKVDCAISCRKASSTS